MAQRMTAAHALIIPAAATDEADIDDWPTGEDSLSDPYTAAMAPGTNIGAATPVQIGAPMPGLPSAPDKEGKDNKDGDHRGEPKDAMTAKVTNDAVALIRSLAELRGRNADWAEKAVREAATLSANAALQAHVIDLVARDPAELLRQVDGRVVEVAGGKTQHLATKAAALEAIDAGWTSRFLTAITDPNVAFILLMIGIYGLIFELISPGAIAPGVVGTICLLVGLYALNLLPINYACSRRARLASTRAQTSGTDRCASNARPACRVLAWNEKEGHVFAHGER